MTLLKSPYFILLSILYFLGVSLLAVSNLNPIYTLGMLLALIYSFHFFKDKIKKRIALKVGQKE